MRSTKAIVVLVRNSSKVPRFSGDQSPKLEKQKKRILIGSTFLITRGFDELEVIMRS